MKFAICNEIYQGWNVDDALTHAARTGYDGLEIAPFTMGKLVTDVSPAERQRVRDVAAKTGIPITGIHWILYFTEGFHLTHPDAAVRTQTAQYLCDLVDFCADLGGKTMVVGSPKQRSVIDGASREAAWERAAAVFQDSVKRAEDRGVTICIEPLSPAETNFINTAVEAMAFADHLNSPAVRIILDVKAMCAEPTPIPEIIRSARGKIAYFHANDRNLKGPGFGDVDFIPIAAALRETGYNGYVSVEVFKFEEGPDVIATKSLDYLKRAFAPSRVG